MKRILCLVFAVTLIAMSGFGQELRFSGIMNYGIGIEFSDEDDADPQIRVFGVDSEQGGGRFRLNASYSNEERTAGADFRIQLQGNSTNTQDLGLAFAYGWVRPVDFLQIKAGLVSDSTFETAGVILRDDAGNGAGAGIFFRLTPIENLDLGVGLYPRGALGSGDNNRIVSPGLAMNAEDHTKYTFGLAYTMPEVFRVTASFRTFNQATGDTPTVADPYPSTDGRTRGRFVGELRLLAVENLTAIFEVELDRLYHPDNDDLFNDDGRINLFQTLAYRMDDLRFGLNAVQYISNADGHDDIALRFNPWVSYTLADGSIVPRLDAVYMMGGEWTGNWDRRGDFGGNSLFYDHDLWVVNVRPSVRLNIDSRTSLEIGNSFYYTNPVVGDGYFNNVIYTDLVVRF